LEKITIESRELRGEEKFTYQYRTSIYTDYQLVRK